MKHFLASFLVLAVCHVMSAQISLEIKGLPGPIEASTAVLQSTASSGGGTSSRRSGGSSSGGQYYLIQREVDSHSGVISSASQKSRFFKTAALVVPLASGERQIINLSNTYISDYTTSLGGGSGNTETFRLNFQSQVTRTK